MKKNKVIAALSGGVDSCVCAALLKQSGSEVEGATLLLKHPDPEFSRCQMCFHEEDARSIAELCGKLGIKHTYIEAYDVFAEKVLLPSAKEYAAGRTPNPCCMCNELVKFQILLDFAARTGADAVATGHYANIINKDGRFFLQRGADTGKDQSYFLYRLGQEALSKVLFPLGGMTKEEVRRIAADFGLSSAAKHDSQDSCFQIPGETFGETLRRAAGLKNIPGRIVYQGKTVGRHNGIHHYTIGQRKGLNVALGVPAFIRRIDPVTADIELATDRTELLCRRFLIENAVWAEQNPPEKSKTLQIQIRYRSRPETGHVEVTQEGAIAVIPDTPLKSVTPGQSAVFYDGNTLLGGGIISLPEL